MFPRHQQPYRGERGNLVRHCHEIFTSRFFSRIGISSALDEDIWNFRSTISSVANSKRMGTTVFCDAIPYNNTHDTEIVRGKILQNFFAVYSENNNSVF